MAMIWTVLALGRGEVSNGGGGQIAVHDGHLNVGGGQGDGEVEGGARMPHAVDEDFAAHGPDDILTDSQAQAGALVFDGNRAVASLEGGEEVRNLFGRDTDTSVADGKFHGDVRCGPGKKAGGKANSAALVGEFHCIA